MNKGTFNSRRLDILYPDVAAEWNYEKNNGLKPSDVTYGSNKKVWWCCEKGHEYESRIKTRSQGYGCPLCAGKEPINERNSLAVLYPNLASQWLQEKNGDITPNDIKPSSKSSVWWRCEKGHEWKAAVYARVKSGSGCPYCAGKLVIKGFNDLATVNPELAKEWNTEKNSGLTADEVHAGSNKSYWWKCSRGHEWQAVMVSRTRRGSGCPYCTNRKVLKGFNDLATIEPSLAKEWHPTLNGDRMPDMFTSGSSRKVWWQCSEGHVWKATVYARTKLETGCPVCAGKTRKNVKYNFVDEKLLSLNSRVLNDKELELTAGGSEDYYIIRV